MITFPDWLINAVLRLRGSKRVYRSEANLLAKVERLRIRPKRSAPPRLIDLLVTVAVSERRGWPCYELRSRTADPQGGPVVYFHGGAYTFEIDPFQWLAVARLAVLASVPIIVPVYPLAPAGTAAATIATAVEIVGDVIADRNPQPVALLGDSAGGGMALAVAQQLGRSDGPHPGLGQLILIAPWLDLTLTEVSTGRNARRDRMLDRPGAYAAGRLYRGELGETDPRVSPLNGDLSQLPPLTVLTGTYDLIHPDAVRLRDRATEAGVPVDYSELIGGQHCYPILPSAHGLAALRHIASRLA